MDNLTNRLPFQDPALPVAARAADLVSRLTLDEKIAQMVHPASGIERLGIPEYNWWNECLHGVARSGVATVFPQAIGLAATWDTALMGQVATVISDEARAKHHDYVRHGIRDIYTGLTFWSPNINIFRDPRWGRGQETYGEDPYLTGRMGVAFVKGLQGDDPRYLKLVATVKHYAVHSGPESARHHFDARVDARDLRETYLFAFEACIEEAHAYSVMGAYNRANGEACCASPTLLDRILRREWGFDGYVVSDCWAINDIFGGHQVAATAAEAAAVAVYPGRRPESGCAFPALAAAVEQGLIAETTIDLAICRLFTARIRLGMFDPPEQVPYTAIPYEVNDSPAHRAVALQAARESIVLLKNDGLLPLPKDLKSLAIIGPNADDLSVLLGNYNGTPSQAITPLEGIRRKLGPETMIYHARGCDIAPGVPPLVAIPSACLRPTEADAGCCGLTGAYYANAHFAGEPLCTRVDPVVDVAWKTMTPFGGHPSEHFSVRWTGALIPPVSGVYRLGVHGSSGFCLWLDGKALTPYAANEHEAFARTVSLALEAGRFYDIRLEYVNDGRQPEVQLIWATPAQDQLSQALETAAKAEAVILVLGLAPTLEGEEMPVQVEGFAGGDRTDIALPATQEDLLRRICALGKPTVLLLLNGSAVAINWAAEHVPAIVEAWYPGEEGGAAIADVLFGDTNPAGRLPVTFYKSVAQLPPFDDYAMTGRTYRYMTEEPLYPFGHGLSYTTFAYDNLWLSDAVLSAGEPLTVTVNVRNTGTRTGDEVVQLYLSYPDTSPRNPIRQLRGFTRVHLAPGESKTVSFTLAAKDLALVNDAGQRVVEAGEYRVSIGGRQPVGADQDGGVVVGSFRVS